MPRRSRLAMASIALVAACATQRPPAPARVAATALPGRLALAPAISRDDALPAWLPVDRATVVVPETDPPVSFAESLFAVPLGGAPVEVRGTGSAAIPFGCDGGTLAVQRLDGAARLPPGPVWLVPRPMPEGFAPEGVAIVAETVAADRRAWRSGPLRIELTRRDATHADLSVSAGGRALWSLAPEKHYMEGAEDAPIDLTLPQEIGMPMPAAAFRTGPNGASLLVFATAGYEGAHLFAVLVDAAGGVAATLPEPAFDLGLYLCAF